MRPGRRGRQAKAASRQPTDFILEALWRAPCLPLHSLRPDPHGGTVSPNPCVGFTPAPETRGPAVLLKPPWGYLCYQKPPSARGAMVTETIVAIGLILTAGVFFLAMRGKSSPHPTDTKREVQRSRQRRNQAREAGSSEDDESSGGRGPPDREAVSRWSDSL